MQTVNREVAGTLKKGDILYHNVLSMDGGEYTTKRYRARVLGRAKFVNDRREFVIDIELLYADKMPWAIDGQTGKLWRTVPEIVKPRRVVRRTSAA